MHFSTPIVHLAVFTAYTQALSLGNPHHAGPSTLSDLARRQQQGSANGNQQAQLITQGSQVNNINNGQSFPSSNSQNSSPNSQTDFNTTNEEATEAAEETTKPPSLKTISKAYKEIYHKEKANNSTTTPAETSELVRVIGQAVGSSSESGDPTIVAKAIETAYENFKSQNGGNNNFKNNQASSQNNAVNTLGPQRNVNFGQDNADFRQNDNNNDYSNNDGDFSNSNSNFNNYNGN